MTDDTSANDGRDDTTLMSRRKLLIGLGAAGAGTLAVLDNFTDVLEDGDSSIREDPPLTNPNDDDNSAFQTPWDADELVVSIVEDEADSPVQGFLEDHGYEEVGNAVAFWNDYINANAAFDLTLTFDRNADNPDIMLRQASTTQYRSGQYAGPDYLNNNFDRQVSELETLTETPTEDDLPINGSIGQGADGPNVYRLIAKHALGRLLGYELWSDPVDVMNPKILITPAHALGAAAKDLYRMPARASSNHHKLTRLTTDPLTSVQNPSNDTKRNLEGLRQTMNTEINDVNQMFDEFNARVDELGLDVYADAYRETIETEDIQYLNDTVNLVTEVLDTYTREELADGPDELNVIADRLETIHNWTDTTVPYDIRIHRYATDKIWSAWATEQTPTETDSA